jgi:hypothetical protein
MWRLALLLRLTVVAVSPGTGAIIIAMWDTIFIHVFHESMMFDLSG